MPRTRPHNTPSLDVLRLSANEVEAINRELDLQGENFRGDDRRIDERHPYRSQAKIVATVFHPGGTTTRYLIKLRNISRTGLAFLHGSFLHMGTQIVVSLETLRHRMVNVSGQIVHCKFIRGNVHEIGVRFTNAIEIEQFILDRDETDGAAGLPRLVGRVLFVEPEEADRQLMRFIFDRLGVQTSTCVAFSDALEKLQSRLNFDVIMADVDAEADPAEALRRLRAIDADVPVIAMTSDEHHPLKKPPTGEPLCAGVLVKPLDAQAVAMALLQHLPLASKTVNHEDAPPLYSALWSDASIRPLVLEYLERLAGQIEQLQQCFGNKTDTAGAAKLCLAIKGSAGSYGYPQISTAAQELRRLVDAGDAGADVAEQLNQLAELCDAACRARHERAA